jgi:hypothetical protein
MRRLTLLSSVILLAVGVAWSFSGCGGSGGTDVTTTSTTSSVPFGGGITPPPGDSGGGSDPVTSCMASKGFQVSSPADVPSLSAKGKRALMQCLQGVHSSGGGIP